MQQTHRLGDTLNTTPEQWLNPSRVRLPPIRGIVTLELSRLIEGGTHDELIRGGGRCAALHRLQGGMSSVLAVVDS